ERQLRRCALADEIRFGAGRLAGDDCGRIAIELVDENLGGREGGSAGKQINPGSRMRGLEPDDRPQEGREQIQITASVVADVNNQIPDLSGRQRGAQLSRELFNGLDLIVEDLIELEVHSAAIRKQLKPEVILHVLQIAWHWTGGVELRRKQAR